jgi:large subunit ribosomal protein L3
MPGFLDGAFAIINLRFDPNMKFILGKKIGMTEMFAADGKRIPVTLVQAGPCQVTQVKTKESDGYAAVQLGYGKIADKKIRKSEAKKPFESLKEYRTAEKDAAVSVGDQIDVAIFKEGELVKVAGISKGKGYQGAVKRFGFGGRKSCTHGQKHEMRNVGSVGMGGASIRKGRKMPGRMGADRITVKNLKIAKVDPQNNILAIRGAVPGRKGTLMEIRGE